MTIRTWTIGGFALVAVLAAACSGTGASELTTPTQGSAQIAQTTDMASNQIDTAAAQASPPTSPQAASPTATQPNARIPAIDAEAPARFETATFALG